MKLLMTDILERDIDLLIIKSFADNLVFRETILELCGIDKSASVLSAAHSLSDEDGESDITFVVEKNNRKIGILIEDKINAIAMPNQAGRYYVRGNKGITNGCYDDFKVMIVAPQEYLDVNGEAGKYGIQLSYETIRNLFDRNSFEYQMLDRALMKKSVGHEVEEIKAITEFWNELYDYINSYYPELSLYGQKGDKKGARNFWFSFKTPVKNTTIVYKADRHLVDLELSGLGKKYQEFVKKNRDVLGNIDYSRIRQAGKSLAISIFTDEDPDCYQQFETQKNVMKEALDKVLYLQEKVLPEINIS